MAALSLHPLSEIPATELLALLTNPEVRRHMPLAGNDWDVESAAAWARQGPGQLDHAGQRFLKFRVSDS